MSATGLPSGWHGRPSYSGMPNRDNIFLIGLMGAGKSTVGRQLARQLGKSFEDTDTLLETRTGVSISLIFDIEGESGFRQWETKVLAGLCDKHHQVIATGGGIVLMSQNRDLMQQSGAVVYLHAAPSLLHERTRHDRNRPLLQVEDRLARLSELYGERDPLYRATAHCVVDSGPVARTCHRVQEALATTCQTAVSITNYA